MMYDYDFPYVNELIYFTCYKIRLKVKKIIPKSDKLSRKKNHIMQHIIFCIAKNNSLLYDSKISRCSKNLRFLMSKLVLLLMFDNSLMEN